MPKKSINKQVKEVLDEAPVTTAAKSKIDVTEVYHDCLARSYADREWREYMDNLINVLTRDMASNFDDIEDARFKQGKIVGLKQLLINSRKAFELSFKINKLKDIK